MSQLGERLRQAREEQGLTLAQVAVDTRIRQQSLIALEEGRYDLLPNDVVAKGFVRNYANCLGLPVDEMIDLYRQENGTTQPIRVIPASTMPRTRSYVLPSFFGVFFVTIALVGLTYVALSASGYVREDELVAMATSTATLTAPTPTQLATEETDPTALNTATTTEPESPDFSGESPAIPAPESTSTPFVVPTEAVAGVAPTPQPTATLEAPIVVEVSVLPGDGEGSWLRVTADGVVAYEQIMNRGEQQIFLAQRNIAIRAGNPTVVQVSVNGLQPEFIGQVPGEPVDWTWPPQ